MNLLWIANRNKSQGGIFDNLSQIILSSESDFSPEVSDTVSEDDRRQAKRICIPYLMTGKKIRKQEYILSKPVLETEGRREKRLAFLNRLTQSPFRLREGGSHMLNIEKHARFKQHV